MISLQLSQSPEMFFLNREEKWSRHVTTVAKILDDSNRKRHLKVYWHYFKLHRSYAISFNWANLRWVRIYRYLS